jgi:hypothetical protein
LGLGEIFDGSIATMRRYWKVQLGTTAAVVLVLTILQAATLLIGTQPAAPRPFSSGASAKPAAGDFAAVLSQFSSGVVSMLAQMVLQGALMIVVGRAVLGQEIEPRAAWRLIRPQVWRLIGLPILIGLICLGVITLPIVAGGVLAAGGAPTVVWGTVLGLGLFVAGLVIVWLWVQFGVSAPVLVLEESTIRTALRRSRRLVAGSWWRVFGILLLNTLATSLLTLVLSLPFVLAGFGMGGAGSAFRVLALIGKALSEVVVFPFGAGVVALLYVDLRMRREGLDLTLTRAAAPGATAGR